MLPFFNLDILMITIYQAKGGYNETSICHFDFLPFDNSFSNKIACIDRK